MKKLFVIFALFAALTFVVACSGSKNKKDEPDNGVTVTDEDSSDADSQDTEPADTEQTDNEQPDNGDSTSDQPDNGDSTTDDADSTTDDAETTQDDDVSTTEDDDADTESNDDTDISSEPKEGIYLGIIGFNQEQYIKKIGFLNQTTVDAYTGFIDGLNKADLTSLYFADYTALKMMHDYDKPPELNNVALVTFTDGLDNISTANASYDPENYGEPDIYRDALHDKIINEKIHDTGIAAYTIGLKGNDVNDKDVFKTTLEKLASEPKEKFVFYTENMDEVMTSFGTIAKSLNSFSKSVNLSVSVPGGYKNGQKLRFTFDIDCDSDSSTCSDKEAAASHLYIEGIFNKSEDGGRNLEEITYHGFTEGAASIPGTLDGFTYRFVFEDIKYADGNNPLLNKDYQKINLWKMSSNGIWDHETEFKRGSSSELNVKRNSALIMLVLDCTSSLGNEFEMMKQAGKDFVTTLANSNSGDNTQVSECTGLPENAKWNKVDKITQTWDEETGWMPSTEGKFNKTTSTTECVFKCNDGYGWSGSKCVQGFTECNGSSESLPCVDPATGYFWSRPSDNKMEWSNAKKHCKNVTDGGFNDWEMPTIDQLRSVIIKCPNTITDGTCKVTDSCTKNECYVAADCSCEQNDTQGYYSKLGFSADYWSATYNASASNNSWNWYVSFGNAEIKDCENKSGNLISDGESHKVVCVRQ